MEPVIDELRMLRFAPVRGIDRDIGHIGTADQRVGDVDVSVAEEIDIVADARASTNGAVVDRHAIVALQINAGVPRQVDHFNPGTVDVELVARKEEGLSVDDLQRRAVGYLDIAGVSPKIKLSAVKSALLKTMLPL